MKSERGLLKYRGTSCLNCSQALDKSEAYCHHCGQLNSTKKLSFDDFFHEFFAGIFAYDSRFSRTMAALLFNPGKISKDYVEGKRQRYANPYKFFLSVSILFFILMGFTESWTAPEPTTEERLQAAAVVDSSLSQLGKIASETDGISLPIDTNNPVDSVALRSSSTSTSAKTPFLFESKETLQDIYKSPQELEKLGFWNSTYKKLEIFIKLYKEEGVTQPEVALKQLRYPVTSYNKWLYSKSVNLQAIASNPQIFLDYFVGKLPFIIFFYLPVLALFIWLLYALRPHNYMEHLVFTFHNQTMWFILFGIALVFDEIFATDAATGIACLVFLFYLYKAMRKFYAQNRVKTIVKFLILNLIFLILAVIAAAFSLIASIAVY